MVTIFYESHGRSVDDEAGIASGHRDALLSGTGRRQAREMGERHVAREIAAVFIVDHTAVHLTLEHGVQGVAWEQVVADAVARPWQPEWRYVLTEEARRRIERDVANCASTHRSVTPS